MWIVGDVSGFGWGSVVRLVLRYLVSLGERFSGGSLALLLPFPVVFELLEFDGVLSRDVCCGLGGLSSQLPSFRSAWFDLVLGLLSLGFINRFEDG